MTNEIDKNNEEDLEIIPMGFLDAQLPDFINDPIEKIESWANIALPEKLREDFLQTVRTEREQS